MINNEEKYFSYLKGKMNPNERNEFENELNKSENLSKEFSDYKKLNCLIDETKNIQLSKDYSESIVTDFRNQLELKSIKKPYFKFKYVFASVLIIIAGYTLFSVLNKENPQEIKSLLTEFSDDEIDLLSSNYDLSLNLEKHIDDAAVKRIDSIYTNNISESVVESIDNKNLETYFSLSDISNATEYLSENDLDLIYDQIINKEIL